jgi:hypothetical protein
MPTFGWQDIDHRLVVLKLIELGEELRTKTKADESRIRFENRLNMNSNTVPSLLLRMRVERSDERARREYEIYCAVWQTQGYVKSAAFVRGVGAHIFQMLGSRANSIANWFSRFVMHTHLPFSLRTAHLKSLDLRMRRLQGRWHTTAIHRFHSKAAVNEPPMIRAPFRQAHPPYQLPISRIGTKWVHNRIALLSSWTHHLFLSPPFALTPTALDPWALHKASYAGPRLQRKCQPGSSILSRLPCRSH